jgi:hypothetical protein
MSCGQGSERPRRGEACPPGAGGTGRREAVTVVRRGRAGGQAARAARGATAPRRAARAAERREWAQRGGAILTCAGRAAADVDAETCPKDVEQEEWRDACRRRECRRPEGLRLEQAESEGRWRAMSVGAGGGRGAGAEAGAGRRAGTEAGAGRRAVRDAAVVPEGQGELGRQTNLPWW